MKKIFYLITLSFLAVVSCKNKDTVEEKENGFVIKGKMDALQDFSVAVLTYIQKDSTITKTAEIKNGEFTFQGKVIHPVEAVIRVRRGGSIPDNYSESDSFHFFIENSEMELTGTESIKNAKLKGSGLTDESVQLSSKVEPLINEIIALQNRMDGRSREEKLITYDTVDVYVDSIKAVAHRFIVSHPNSYVALQRFLRHEMPKNFNPKEAEVLFNKFPENLRSTPTGEKIYAKITTAKKSMIGEVAMDFTQTSIDGTRFNLSSLRGKYVLVDFWAAWCKPCRAENPFVVKAYNKYKDQNFEIVGVSLDASKEMWVNAVEKDGLPWIHVSDLKHWKNEVALQYDINSVPANVLIDPDGVIIAKNLRGEALTDRLSEIFNRVIDPI